MKPNKITIHCTDTKNGEPVAYETIDAWHKARGWQGFGYHGQIDVDGSWRPGRPLNIPGAHVQGENRGNIGIVLSGKDKFTPAQFKTLKYQIDSICMVYDIPRHQVYLHREFESARAQGKTCPNMEVHAFLGWLLVEDWKAIAPYLFVANS